LKKFYSLLLRVLGWKSTLKINLPAKCVICVAPHTSNWDLFIGMIFYKSLIGKPHFLMKKDWFFFPLGYFFKSLGGIPVNRGKKTFMSEQLAKLFDTKKYFHLAITPEGTRKKNALWKSGFYYIAQSAKVPIVLAYIDYAKKEIGAFNNFYPTGNVDKDIEEIKQYYRNVKGKHPAEFAM
jgi:1-acyl-sn-glycerol-3-phosphate acyltransferase